MWPGPVQCSPHPTTVIVTWDKSELYTRLFLELVRKKHSFLFWLGILNCENYVSLELLVPLFAFTRRGGRKVPTNKANTELKNGKTVPCEHLLSPWVWPCQKQAVSQSSQFCEPIKVSLNWLLLLDNWRRPIYWKLIEQYLWSLSLCQALSCALSWETFILLWGKWNRKSSTGMSQLLRAYGTQKYCLT